MKLKPEISWADFDKLDIRSGTIISVNDFEKARNPSYQLEIDFGDLGIRKSAAQITTLYNKEDLVGKQIVAVVNFPKNRLPISSVNVWFWEFTEMTTKMLRF